MNTNTSIVSKKTLDERLKKGYTQYTPEIAAYWDVFIDWKKRKASEGNFFIDILHKYDAKKILDVACGTGYDTVRLLKEGFNLKSSDGSLFMLTKARINAEDNKVKIDAKFADWRRLSHAYNEKFDAIIFLGNSFAHVFDKKDRENILKQIFNLLRDKNGIFIIDQRNYDKILDKGFSSKHKYVYCGEDLIVSMTKANDNLVTNHYKYKSLKFYFDLYPIRFKELTDLLRETGFSVESYGDFTKTFSSYEPDFIQHVCVKNIA